MTGQAALHYYRDTFIACHSKSICSISRGLNADIHASPYISRQWEEYLAEHVVVWSKGFDMVGIVSVMGERGERERERERDRKRERERGARERATTNPEHPNHKPKARREIETERDSQREKVSESSTAQREPTANCHTLSTVLSVNLLRGIC